MAEEVNGAHMKSAALDIVGRLPQATTYFPVQAVDELFYLPVRKAGRRRLGKPPSGPYNRIVSGSYCLEKMVRCIDLLHPAFRKLTEFRPKACDLVWMILLRHLMVCSLYLVA